MVNSWLTAETYALQIRGANALLQASACHKLIQCRGLQACVLQFLTLPAQQPSIIGQPLAAAAITRVQGNLRGGDDK
jgi:hypothetical protein